MIGADPDGLVDLFHLKCRAALQAFGQMALVCRIEVQDDDEGQSAVGRNLTEESIQGFQTAGRGADADDGRYSSNRHSGTRSSDSLSPPWTPTWMCGSSKGRA